MVKNSIYHDGPEGGIQLITKDSSIIQLIEKARKIEKQRKIVEKMIKQRRHEEMAKNITFNNVSVIINRNENTTTNTLQPPAYATKTISPERQSFESLVSNSLTTKSQKKLMVSDV